VKLEVFQAGKGDCLLLTSDDGKRVLVDGGMEDAYRDHVAPALGKLRDQRKAIDLLYVSHIDDDHIGGVLKLLSDELAWRVFDFQKKVARNSKAKPPTVPRPAEIAGIWHNAFDMQLDKNTGRIEDALATSAALLEASPRVADLEEAARMRELVTGVDSALRVSHRVGADQLDIPLNKQFGKKLAMARPGQRPIRMGSLKMTVIGPHQDHLDRLRKWWNDWISDVENQGKLERVREDMADDAKKLETGDVDGFNVAIQNRALEFSDRVTKTVVPKRPGITEPNLASLMLFVEEDGKRLLLTGDGAGEDIVEGLERAGVLPAGAGIHVDVLKVQHHGAVANVKADFCRRVTADNYVLCGNGDHKNPEKDVLNRIIDSRLEPRARGSHAGVDRPFKLWFNSSVQVCGTTKREAHMDMVEKLVAKREAESGGQMRKSRFLRSGSSYVLEP
jgi:beta-lactamase superfamily II metal-dependent hydrolase